jgi:dTDP-4-dehydrorhamnose 3,5-epimerase
MKLLHVTQLAIPDIKVIRFARFRDQRGYFSEIFRKSGLKTNALTSFLADVDFYQANESYSRTGTVRGLHFQWNPYMGKLVRTLHGRMVDLVMDIRKGSPTFAKIIAHDMPSRPAQDWSEWIWVPPGFAHGNMFPEETSIEYFCSGEYSPSCEAGISPLATDIDWSLCDAGLRDLFQQNAGASPLLSEKDRAGLSVRSWENDPRSDNFVFGKPLV